MSRRAKYVLNRQEMHQALGLPDDVRVAGMHVTPDPDMVHVMVDGGVPEYPLAGGDMAAMAWEGTVEAPVLQHPFGKRSDPASAAQTPAGGVTLHGCQVDESVGGGDEAAEFLEALWDQVRSCVLYGFEPDMLREVFGEALEHAVGNEDTVRRQTDEVIARILDADRRRQAAPMTVNAAAPALRAESPSEAADEGTLDDVLRRAAERARDKIRRDVAKAIRRDVDDMLEILVERLVDVVASRR